MTTKETMYAYHYWEGYLSVYLFLDTPNCKKDGYTRIPWWDWRCNE